MRVNLKARASELNTSRGRDKIQPFGTLAYNLEIRRVFVKCYKFMTSFKQFIPVLIEFSANIELSSLTDVDK
jgi:hypothetical protein